MWQFLTPQKCPPSTSSPSFSPSCSAPTVLSFTPAQTMEGDLPDALKYVPYSNTSFKLF